MKILTVLGTRPEIIRLSCIIPKLDNFCDHILVNTGQNYDPYLNENFFKELRIREPDYSLGIRGDSFGEQVGKIISSCEHVLKSEQPDRLLILGDTNSCLTSIVAKRMGVMVFHMEAGNRCYDDRVPEEVNRRIIDHSSDILMPYTERSRKNLLYEGISGDRIFVTGNPIFEVINFYKDSIKQSGILKKLGLQKKKYFLVTIHRAENVDDKERLHFLINSLGTLQKRYKIPIICSLHPHTKDKIQKYQIALNNENIDLHAPFGFFDFIYLEQNACCVLSDSGTVQEECCIFQTPNVTLRDVTERPETIECGSNMLSGVVPENIMKSVDYVTKGNANWTVPSEYLERYVSNAIIKILCGFY